MRHACCGVLLLGLALGVASSRLSADDTSPARNKKVGAALRALDRELQRRFLDMSRGFGAARMLPAGMMMQRHRSMTNLYFLPENDAEIEAVQQLSAVNLDLFLYVAGPSHVEPTPPSSSDHPVFESFKPWRPRPQVFGPIAVAHRSGDTPPEAASLHDEARRSFVALRTEDVIERTEGDWQLIMRPVRAANASCIACHNGNPERPASATGTLKDYRIGDVLGVLIYATRPSSSTH